MEQWRSIATSSMSERLADPFSRDTFQACVLDHAERERNREAYKFHCDVIALKRTDPVLSAIPTVPIDGAVLSASSFLIRFFGPGNDDRMLIVNLGADLDLNPAPEPLLAPPEHRNWRSIFSTEVPEYGGSGTPAYEEVDANWMIPGRSAALFRAIDAKKGGSQ
jgi:maltooligosyltrehalose trehalohydrolase